MKKFIRSISVATLAMAMAIPAMADRVLNADVVVVGAGAGGTVAAASAQEAGLKTVLLEKNAFAGGQYRNVPCRPQRIAGVPAWWFLA